MNEFQRADDWQLIGARRFLDPFYAARGYRVERHPGDHPLQRRHVDVSLHTAKGIGYHIDEKILHGLRKGGRAGKISIETWSCSIPGREKRGWISRDEPNDATVLFICHAEEISDQIPDCWSPESWRRVTYLDCLWIPFLPLRDWFAAQNEEQWELFHNNQFNRSLARKVPINEVRMAVRGFARFRVTAPFGSICDQSPLLVSM
jgi:hypothetical protein